MKDQKIEEILVKLWFHLRITDELLDELPKEAIRHIAKSQKKGNRDKLSIQYKLKSMLRDTKGIHEVDLFQEDENQTQVAASVIEIMRDLFLRADLPAQYSFVKIWEEVKEHFGDIEPELADKIAISIEETIKNYRK